MPRPNSFHRVKCRQWALLLAIPLAGCAGHMRPRSPYTCVANTTGIPEMNPSIVQDARSVCHALDPTSNAVVGPLSFRGVHDAISRGGSRITFYSGHGKKVSAKSGGVQFQLAGPNQTLTAKELLAAVLGDDRTRVGDDADYRILLLNTCDSGYLSLPTIGHAANGRVSLPIALIASGYGRIDRSSQGDVLNTNFGAALGQALQGAADQTPFGNCDEIVTDEEAVHFVDDWLRGHSRMASDEWQLQPTAVLKRNVEFTLPLVHVSASNECRAPNWKLLETHLPETLRQASRQHRRFLRGLGSPPPGPHHFVVLTKSQDLAQQFAHREFLSALGSIAARLDYAVIDATSSAPKDVRDALEASSFMDTLLVEARPSPFGDFYLELTSPRDRSIVWAYQAALPVDAASAAELAQRLARRLRRRFELVDLELGAGKRLLLRVRGAVPKGLLAMPWDDFAQGGKPNPSHQIALLDENGNSRLEVSPCPGAVGQCFFLDDPELSRDSDKWTLLSEPN